MDQLTIEELPYSVDSSGLFSQLLDLQQPIYLDSCAAYSPRGRYDILTAEPLKIINPHENHTYESTRYKDKLNYFIAIKEAIAELTPSMSNDYHLPFIGGALGCFGYDLGRQLERLPNATQQDLQLSTAQVGIYNWAIIVDHRQRRTVLVAQPQADASLLTDIRQRLSNADQDNSHKHFNLKTPFKSNMTTEQYQLAFHKVKAYIDAGDCYQVNLAQRFSSHYEGDPWAAYLSLRATAAAPFSAFMKFEHSTVMSMSPERFLQVGNQRVTTSPIKGTTARSSDPETDAQLAQQLLQSAKDRAENLMIVDLLRNDLGKCCQPGSIQVDELFELQSFETVHHLVSSISGQLRKDCDALQLLAACFPGGSITGAPKIRAMEIIEELEPHRRSAYCGSLGYISCDGQMDTNIAIRTMLCEDQQIHCWAGGGIVADSKCEGEYQECFTKVDKLFAALT